MNGAVPSRLLFGADGWRVEWLWHDGARFTEPFFEQTLARLKRSPNNRSRRPSPTNPDALSEASDSPPVTAIIFHVSRCGSTLMCQMLSGLPAHIVVAEAPVLDDILRARRSDPDVTDAQRIAWLRGAVRALGARRQPEERQLFVKLDCWHIFELALVRRAFPGVPLLFLHRHPLEVLASLIRLPSLTTVRDTVTPEQLGLTPEERDALSPAAHAAAVLGAIYRAANRHRAELTPVAYEDVAEFVRRRLPGRPFSDEERAVLSLAAQRDAKNPAQSFTPDSASKRVGAGDALRQAAERWTEPEYRRWLELSQTPELEKKS